MLKYSYPAKFTFVEIFLKYFLYVFRSSATMGPTTPSFRLIDNHMQIIDMIMGPCMWRT
jgi:hypothetical protein